MGDIQEQLQNLTNIRDIQDKVVVLRKELPTVYEEFLKKQTIAAAEKIVRAKVIFEPPKLIIPKMENIDLNNINKQSGIKIDEIYKHAKNIEECLKYLNH